MFYLNDKLKKLTEILKTHQLKVSVKEKFDGQFISIKIEDDRILFRSKYSPFVRDYADWFYEKYRHNNPNPKYENQPIPLNVHDFNEVGKAICRNFQLKDYLRYTNEEVTFELLNFYSEYCKVDKANNSVTFVNTPYQLDKFPPCPFVLISHNNLWPQSFHRTYYPLIITQPSVEEFIVYNEASLLNLVRELHDPVFRRKFFLFGSGEGYVLTFTNGLFNMDLKLKTSFNHKTKASEKHREWVEGIINV